MKNIKKIAIIGNSGSGKSNLAQKLHKKLGLPIYHLDKYFWKSNWTQPNFDEYKKAHDKLCDQPEWIIDGMSLRTLEYRIQKADTIIFLNFPRYLCLWRVFKRTISYYGKENPSSAEKCPEKFNWRFIKFLKWIWGFKQRYSRIVELLNIYSDTKSIYILKSQKEVDQFIKKLNQKYL